MKTRMRGTKSDFPGCSSSVTAVGNEEGNTDEPEDEPLGLASIVSFILKPSPLLCTHEDVIMGMLCLRSCPSDITNKLPSLYLLQRDVKAGLEITTIVFIFRKLLNRLESVKCAI